MCCYIQRLCETSGRPLRSNKRQRASSHVCECSPFDLEDAPITGQTVSGFLLCHPEHPAQRHDAQPRPHSPTRPPIWPPPSWRWSCPPRWWPSGPYQGRCRFPRISSKPASGISNWVRVAAITTSEARGTPAMPLEVSINVNNIVICVPMDISMP